MKVQLMKLMVHQKKKFSINFTKGNTKFCLSLHYNANGNVYNFSVDYNTIDKSDILSIHKYLMTKNNIK